MSVWLNNQKGFFFPIIISWEHGKSVRRQKSLTKKKLYIHYSKEKKNNVNNTCYDFSRVERERRKKNSIVWFSFPRFLCKNFMLLLLFIRFIWQKLLFFPAILITFDYSCNCHFTDSFSIFLFFPSSVLENPNLYVFPPFWFVIFQSNSERKIFSFSLQALVYFFFFLFLFRGCFSASRKKCNPKLVISSRKGKHDDRKSYILTNFFKEKK